MKKMFLITTTGVILLAAPFMAATADTSLDDAYLPPCLHTQANTNNSYPPAREPGKAWFARELLNKSG